MLIFRVFFLFLLCLTSVKLFAFSQQKISLEVGGKGSYLTIPVPHHLIPVASDIKVFNKGLLVKADVSYGLIWPKLAGELDYVRLINIVIQNDIRLSSITLVWQNSHKKLLKTSKRLMMNSEFVYPDSQWLRKSLLLTERDSVDEQWYRDVQKLRAEYIIDEKALAKNKYPRFEASQWLYDRPQALYQLFIATGEDKWKRSADRFVAFYISQVDSDGYFKLSKPNDIKYLMGRSIVYQYLLNQRESSIEVIERLYQASLSWSAQYNSNFWTERHHAAALNVAISYWELTNDTSAYIRVNNLINNLWEMTFLPENNWPKEGCPQHSFRAHEGWGDDSPACSPWMMALVADQLWRYYWLTSSPKAARLLIAFSHFVADKGVYVASKGKIKGQIIPKYLVSLQNAEQEELDPFSDRQHTCDVAAMVGKGVYIQTKLGSSSNPQAKKVFQQLAERCKKQHLAVLDKYKYVKLTHLVSKPPRKFAWLYSSTDDLPWLLSIFKETNKN